MKILETLNNVALAFVALPESIREARAILAEQREEADDLERVNRLDRYNRELECQRSERANAHSAALEKLRDKIAELEALNSKGNAGFAELMNANSVLQFQVSSGLKDIEKLEFELATLRAKDARGGYAVEAESELRDMANRAKPEPSIPEPDPGEGWELCDKETAEWYVCKQRDYPDIEWNPWCEMRYFHDYTDMLYRFRRPIAKPAPQWVACTAEEARANPGESQFRGAVSGDWIDCLGYAWTRADRPFPTTVAYRTTAVMGDLIEVSESTWNREPESCRSHYTYAIAPKTPRRFYFLRSTVPVGTVLG